MPLVSAMHETTCYVTCYLSTRASIGNQKKQVIRQQSKENSGIRLLVPYRPSDNTIFLPPVSSFCADRFMKSSKN